MTARKQNPILNQFEEQMTRLESRLGQRGLRLEDRHYEGPFTIIDNKTGSVIMRNLTLSELENWISRNYES